MDLTAALRQARSTEERYEFIRRYVTEWLGVPLQDWYGYTERELCKAEELLGVRLPPAVRDFYLMLGRRRELTGNQDQVVPPGWEDESAQVLVFRVENQHCAEWGIPAHLLHLADPPVWYWANGAPGEPEPWRPFLESFSLAAVEIVLSESLFADHGLCDNREWDEDAGRALRERYERLPIPAYPAWWATSDEPPIRWYAGPDVILREDAEQWVWVRARTARALRSAREALLGEWNLDR
ncbi:SMI1/KNR4 family protein [Thermomonospora catenispora]|uniref:SMI1/KNR4 family protein n=1 Tax=Thermomonospora catenispora TaxID=2493090 RepID=UPI0011214874|nr:SMI1/KNR4 family protein [Thermomonospora catenispora]TNY37808.1 SMI1/KNR4 family protein [Thermomonospora catenispora]